MKTGIMQPYFFPYIGYFQLINSVDQFVVYDIIKYTKKGWINRNRILMHGKESYISLPIQKDSDYLNVNERFLAKTWNIEKRKMLNLITESYRKSPFFTEVFPVIEQCIEHKENNLFLFIYNSLNVIREYLEIPTPFVISSNLDIDQSLRSDEKVIAICKKLGSEFYINAIGGMALYSKEEFKKNNIELYFLKSDDIRYKQFDNEFIPNLSILDVMMFNPKEKIQEYLKSHVLI